MRPLQEKQIEKQTAPFPSFCPAKTDYFRKHFLVLWDAAVSLKASQPALWATSSHLATLNILFLCLLPVIHLSDRANNLHWPALRADPHVQTFCKVQIRLSSRHFTGRNTSVTFLWLLQLLFYCQLQRAADPALSPCLNAFLLHVLKVD